MFRPWGEAGKKRIEQEASHQSCINFRTEGFKSMLVNFSNCMKDFESMLVQIWKGDKMKDYGWGGVNLPFLSLPLAFPN